MVGWQTNRKYSIFDSINTLLGYILGRNLWMELCICHYFISVYVCACVCVGVCVCVCVCMCVYANWKPFYKFKSRLVCKHFKICVLIRHIFCETLMRLCLIKHKWRSFLCYFFSHRLMFSTYPNIESRKSKMATLG